MPNPAVIERNAPTPNHRKITSFGAPIAITATMRALAVGDAFRIDQPEQRDSIYGIAHRVGIKVTTVKDQEKLFIKRVK